MYAKLGVQVKDVEISLGDALLLPKSKNTAHKDYHASDERSRHGYVETPSAFQAKESREHNFRVSEDKLDTIGAVCLCFNDHVQLLIVSIMRVSSQEKLEHCERETRTIEDTYA